MADFTLVGLQVIREVARCGSFSLAGERLGYTQSAVSRQIAAMESVAGQALFDRHARGVSPTEAGWVVLRHAEGMLGELDAVRHHLDELRARPARRLRIGAISTAMAALVPRAIAVTQRRDPRAQLPLREGSSRSLLRGIARKRLDLAVVAAPEDAPEGIQFERLCDEPLFVATASGDPLTEADTVSSPMLRSLRWIAGSSDPGSSLLGAWSDPDADAPEIAFVARDWVAKLGLVAAGLGATVVPGLAVATLPVGVAISRIDHPAAVRRIVVARRAGVPVNGFRMFVDVLRDVAVDLLGEPGRRRLLGN